MSGLRRDAGCAQGVLGECDQGRCHVHRAHQEKEGHRYGRRLCFVETMKNFVRLWRLSQPSKKRINKRELPPAFFMAAQIN